MGSSNTSDKIRLDHNLLIYEGGNNKLSMK